MSEQLKQIPDQEDHVWIQKVLGASDEETICREVDGLVFGDVSLMTEYEAAQNYAAEFIQRQEAVPKNLVSAIKLLANQSSGFIGLSVHEAYVGFLRSKQLSELQ
jgi:hypothetical protein